MSGQTQEKDQQDLTKEENKQEEGEDQKNNSEKNSEQGETITTIDNVELNAEGVNVKVDWMEILEDFLQKNIVKQPTREDEKTCFRKMMRMELTGKLCEILFNIVYLVKFGEQRGQECMLGVDPSDLLLEKRMALGGVYTQLYSQVVAIKLLTSSQLAEVVNHLLFALSYVIHMTFFKVFRIDRIHFTLRFILDCYHILIFEVNGVYVSDYYLQVQFDKIFTCQFLQYEKEDNIRLVQKSDNLNKDKYNFLGRKLDYDKALQKAINVEHGHDFALKLHGTLHMQDRPKQKLIKQERKKEPAKKEEESQLHNRSQSINRAKSDMATGRLRLNCIQISPTISQFLDNHKMVLPNRRNKMVQHSLEKMDQHSLQDLQNRQNLIYNQMKQFQNKQKTQSLFPKVNHKSLVDIYNVKVDYDSKAQRFPQFFRDMEEHYEILKQHLQKVKHLPSSKKMFENLTYYQMNQLEGDPSLFENLDDKEKVEQIAQLHALSLHTEQQHLQQLKRLQANNLDKVSEATARALDLDNERGTNLLNPPEPKRLKGCTSLPPLEEQNLNRFTKEYIHNMNILLGGRAEKLSDVYNHRLTNQYQQKYSHYIKDDTEENINNLKKEILHKHHMMQNNLSRLIKKRKV